MFTLQSRNLPHYLLTSRILIEYPSFFSTSTSSSSSSISIPEKSCSCRLLDDRHSYWYNGCALRSANHTHVITRETTQFSSTNILTWSSYLRSLVYVGFLTIGIHIGLTVVPYVAPITLMQLRGKPHSFQQWKILIHPKRPSRRTQLWKETNSWLN